MGIDTDTEAQMRIGIAVPEPLGMGGGGITGADIKVHQVGAIKRGGKRSSEPPEGVGPGEGPSEHPSHPYSALSISQGNKKRVRDVPEKPPQPS